MSRTGDDAGTTQCHGHSPGIAGSNATVQPLVGPHAMIPTMADGLTTLYRPTGEAELALVAASGYTAWPPRLPEQPIFYPVTNEEYAVQIARDWNAGPDATGFVTEFEVESIYIERFEPRIVGDSQTHVEYWIPAEELDEFNGRIAGAIRVIRAFRGRPPIEVAVQIE